MHSPTPPSGLDKSSLTIYSIFVPENYTSVKMLIALFFLTFHELCWSAHNTTYVDIDLKSLNKNHANITKVNFTYFIGNKFEQVPSEGDLSYM